MYHCVYIIVNKVNQRYYIGKHSTNNLADGYLGSGIVIQHAVAKYGKDNFTKEIIEVFEHQEDAYEYERYLTYFCLKDKKCYNLIEGGKGFTSKSGKRASNAAHKKGYYGFRSFDKEKLIPMCKQAGVKGADANRKNGTGMFGFTFEQRSIYSHLNNMDIHWITNGEIDSRIKKDEEIPEGFRIGRCNSGMCSEIRAGYNCWTNGVDNVFSLGDPGLEGFVPGMTKTTPTAKMPWWNNGVINKRTKECPGDGFVPGRLRWQSKIVECPHCGTSGGETAMKRHHFNHCKFRGDV